MKLHHTFQIYSVVNDAATFARDLRSSPDIGTYDIPLTVLWNEASASAAYAMVMRDAYAEFLIFVHQDVYLPRGWFAKLEREIDRLSEFDPGWAVAGLSGVRADGSRCAHVWDSGLGRVCFGPFGNPVAVVSLDELLLIIRRGAMVSFDPELPNSISMELTSFLRLTRKASLRMSWTFRRFTIPTPCDCLGGTTWKPMSSW